MNTKSPSYDISDKDQFTSVTFRNYKAFKRFSITLRDFNVLVGPNNSGKSTIIGAFRILSEGIRKAATRKSERIRLRGEDDWGYRVPLEDLPVSTENIFTNYDESQPARIEFRLLSGNKLSLIFPEANICYLICETKSRPVKSPSDFKREYKISVGFVPVLGPVEHEEQLYQKEAARRALLTHRASRNFRNIWYHYPEGFDEFRELIQATWPGMDIKRPEIQFYRNMPILYMFCPEERYPREIYWAGFGFQVWCQMLTYIVRSKNDSLLIIDEPDIYLHSDLQRQLVAFLKTLGPDILLATHSTEIISETDPGDLLVINKKANAAKRISDPSQLQSVFNVLGSNLNPILTQLAKSKHAVFVEGKDFQIFAAFARKLSKSGVANRSEFAVIPVEGFNPQKVNDFSKGVELALGSKLMKAVIFDRDYRSPDEAKEVKDQLLRYVDYAHIHNRKEIENYLLDPTIIDRALKKRIQEHNKRSGDNIILKETSAEILDALTKSLKNRVSGQYLSKRTPSEKAKHPELDYATINQKLLDEFESSWVNLETRLTIVPGKELFSQMNRYLQETYKVTLSFTAVINAMRPDEVPGDIQTLIEAIDSFRVTDRP